MNKELSMKAMQLMQNGNFEEAYQEFSKLYQVNNRDYEALYLRSLIDFGHLRAKIEQTICDLEYLSSFNNKFKFPSLHLLTIHYDMEDNFEKVIEFGEKIKDKVSKNEQGTKLLIDIYFLLARAYYHRFNDQDAQVALEYLNLCIKLAEDDLELDYFLLKVDLLISLKKFDEADHQIEEIQTNFGTSSSLYFSKEKLYYVKGLELEEKDPETANKYFEQALEYLDFCEKYNGDLAFINYSRVEILTHMKKYNEALSVLNQMENNENKEDVLIEKIKIYETLEDLQTPINLCEAFLEKQDSWKIKYSLAYLIAYQADNIETLKRTRKLYLDAYRMQPKTFILYDLFPINNKLKNFEENYQLLKEHFKDQIMEGRAAYLLAIMAQTISRPYEEQYELYLKAHSLGYINQLEFLDEAVSLAKNPKQFYKQLLSHQNDNLNSLDAWSKRKMGVRYLYGEFGYPKDYDLAQKYLKKAYQELSEKSCMSSILGRLYEFKNDYNQMKKYYLHAHNLYLNNIFTPCNCSEGYLAHAYLNGYGVEKNKEEAKKLIIAAVENLGKYSANIVIYLYAYFALNKEDNFDLNYAKELLDTTHAFHRYEISKYMMLKQVKKKLNEDITMIDKQIKLCVKFGNQLVKKYYKENINKEISYPYFNDF